MSSQRVKVTLSLASFISTVLAQQCPSGYAPASTTGQGPIATDVAAVPAIEWQPCPVEKEPTLECAILDVPMDWTQPQAAERLGVPVVRVPAKSSNPRNQTLIFNFGGPGGSGVDVFIDGVGSDLQELRGDDWHVATFDPRGVALNNPYRCPKKATYEDDDLDDDDTPDFDVPDYTPHQRITPDSQEWFQDILDTFKEDSDLCAGEEYKEAGELVGSAFAARDVKAFAEALGEDGFIRYEGGSYGTLLGATVAAMFPDQVDRMIIDGNINPTDYWFGIGAETVYDYDNAMHKFFNSCATVGPDVCSFAVDGESGQQLLDYHWSIYTGLKNGSIILHDAEDNSTITHSLYQSIMGRILFSGPRLWGRFYDTMEQIYELVKNETSGTATKSSLTVRDSPFNPMDASGYEAVEGNILIAVTCGDGIRFGDVDSNELEQLHKIWANTSYYGAETMESLLWACATWSVDAKEKYTGKFENITTRSPILYIQNEYDPVTPSESARNSSFGFPNSGILWHDGMGHCSNRDPSEEVNAKRKEYLATGKLPDLSEVAQPDQPVFPAANANSKSVVPRTPEQEKYQAAAARVAKAMNKRRLPASRYPSQLLAGKRDVFDVMRQRKRSAATATDSVPPTCTATGVVSPAIATGSASRTFYPTAGFFAFGMISSMLIL